MNLTINPAVSADRSGYMFVLPWDVHHTGGVNEVVINLFNQMSRAGTYTPLLMVGRWEDRHPREECVAGRTTIYCRLPSPSFKQSPLLSFVKLMADLPTRLLALARILKRRRVGVVNIHYPSAQILSFAILKRL